MKEFTPVIEKRPTHTLIPYAKNAKVHSDAQVDKIAGQISAFGFDQPIVIDEHGVIIKGHGRHLAAQKLGMQEVPVIVSTLDEYQAMAARIADNKVAQGDTDSNILKFELGTLKLRDFDLKLTGMDDFELQPLLSADEMLGRMPIGDEPSNDDEREPEPVRSIDQKVEEETKAQVEETVETVMVSPVVVGEIYTMGRHRLMCGSALDPAHRSLLIGSSAVDMLLTDPPYGIKQGVENFKAFESKSKVAATHYFPKIEGDENTDTATQICAALDGMNINVAVIWGANHFAHALPETASWLVWDKRVEDNQRDNLSDCELAWVKAGTKSVRIFRHLWKGMIKASEHGQARCHPTQKPIALSEWCINEYAPDAKVVLDLFAGSGSALMAAERLGKSCLAMELSPEYVATILNRWAKATGQDPVRSDGASWAALYQAANENNVETQENEQHHANHNDLSSTASTA